MFIPVTLVDDKGAELKTLLNTDQVITLSEIDGKVVFTTTALSRATLKEPLSYIQEKVVFE
jgi:hypothetical protein